MRRLRLLLASLAMSAALSGIAQELGKPNASSLQALSWYDKGVTKRLWMDPELMVEFGAPGGSPADSRGSRSARVLARGDQAATRALREGRSSPLLRDVPGGPVRALPGNVIVYLNPAWTEIDVAQWLSANRLQVLRRFPVGHNAYILSAPPGLASLELANRLQESGTVVSAEPEWWVQVQSR